MGKPTSLYETTGGHAGEPSGSALAFFPLLELPPTAVAAVAAGAEHEADMGIGMAMGLVPDFFDL